MKIVKWNELSKNEKTLSQASAEEVLNLFLLMSVISSKRLKKMVIKP